MKCVCVQGLFVGSRAMFEEMDQAIAEHQLRSVVHRASAFGEIRDAMRHPESGAHFEKIVLRL